jgi:hypothetical protein
MKEKQLKKRFSSSYIFSWVHIIIRHETQRQRRTVIDICIHTIAVLSIIYNIYNISIESMYINIHVGRAIKMKNKSAARREHKQQFLAMMKTGRDNRERHYLFFFLCFLNTLNRFRVLSVLSV